MEKHLLELTPTEELKVARIKKHEARTIKEIISPQKLPKPDFEHPVSKKLPVPIRRLIPFPDEDLTPRDRQELTDILTPWHLNWTRFKRPYRGKWIKKNLTKPLDPTSPLNTRFKVLRIEGMETFDLLEGDQTPKVTSTINKGSTTFKELNAPLLLPPLALERLAALNANDEVVNALHSAKTEASELKLELEVLRSSLKTKDQEIGELKLELKGLKPTLKAKDQTIKDLRVECVDNYFSWYEDFRDQAIGNFPNMDFDSFIPPLPTGEIKVIDLPIPSKGWVNSSSLTLETLGNSRGRLVLTPIPEVIVEAFGENKRAREENIRSSGKRLRGSSSSSVPSANFDDESSSISKLILKHELVLKKGAFFLQSL
ncbi:unnamed protein product [Ilex paraguariensis]|uniref:Uncharacterized protein n=1 Tax=Ilex paraguariensis TaxID=185542 RepID=A0ABC8SX17_9AQUA